MPVAHVYEVTPFAILDNQQQQSTSNVHKGASGQQNYGIQVMDPKTSHVCRRSPNNGHLSRRALCPRATKLWDTGHGPENFNNGHLSRRALCPRATKLWDTGHGPENFTCLSPHLKMDTSLGVLCVLVQCIENWTRSSSMTNTYLFS